MFSWRHILCICKKINSKHPCLLKLCFRESMCNICHQFVAPLYVKQKLSVKSNKMLSCTFEETNGVKQGGVMSPILYCLYIDGLLSELQHWSRLLHGTAPTQEPSGLLITLKVGCQVCLLYIRG